MSSRPFNPLPTVPNPIQWDVPGRIAELQSMIDDPATSEPQKINLQTAINLYHAKELPGRLRYIQDGKVVCLEKIDLRRSYWSEGYCQQLSTRAMIPAAVPKPFSESSQCAPANASNQQLANRTAYNHYADGQGLGQEVLF